jgi:hypothetical protein
LSGLEGRVTAIFDRPGLGQQSLGKIHSLGELSDLGAKGGELLQDLL